MLFAPRHDALSSCRPWEGIITTQRDHRKHFSSRVGSFALATSFSRVLGYARDALVAHFFGGGAVTDAFYAAFRIPNLLRRFFGEGSFTAAFVPVFTEVTTTQDEWEARRFYHAIFSGLSLLLIILVGLGILLAPLVASLTAWGFSREPGKLWMTIQLVRLTFPFLLFVSLAALASGVLNTRGCFFIPAFAPAGLSIAEIAFILLLASRFREPIYGLAVSAAIGGFLHWALQLPSLSREGFPLGLARPKIIDTTRILKLMAPTVIGLSADQINSYVDTLCASFLATGSVTALYNSNRVMQLPLALFGIAVASVALPALSKSTAENDIPAYKDTLVHSLRTANFLIIPATLGLIMIGHPIIQLLFQHGRFTASETNLTYAALVGFTIGLPAYSGTKILASAFFALKDTKTPMRAALWAMVANVGLDVTLMWKWGVGGLAFATSASAWVNMGVLFLLLRKKVGLISGKEVIRSGVLVFVASLLMGEVAQVLVFRLHGPLIARVFIAVLGGTAAFFAFSHLFNLEERKHFSSWLPRFRRVPPEIPGDE